MRVEYSEAWPAKSGERRAVVTLFVRGERSERALIDLEEWRSLPVSLQLDLLGVLQDHTMTAMAELTDTWPETLDELDALRVETDGLRVALAQERAANSQAISSTD